MSQIQAIYQQHAKSVFRFALGLCGDRHLANDLVAESFVRAMLSSTPIEMETVLGYLCTIARRLYLKEWHRQQRHLALEDIHEDPACGPEQQAMDSQSLQLTLAALQTLPEVDRTALLMRAQDQVPYEDIARALGISLASAKVKVSRARIKLSLTLKGNTP
ncbi:MAG: sigma-70 family RNA polymerase sigma factor [Comamonadaceae bacterium]